MKKTTNIISKKSYDIFVDIVNGSIQPNTNNPFKEKLKFFEIYFDWIISFDNKNSNFNYKIFLQLSPNDINNFSKLLKDKKNQNYKEFEEICKKHKTSIVLDNINDLSSWKIAFNKSEFNNIKITLNYICKLYYDELIQLWYTKSVWEDLNSNIEEEIEREQYVLDWIWLTKELWISNLFSQEWFLEIDEEDLLRNQHVERFKDAFKDVWDYILFSDKEIWIEIPIAKNPEYSLDTNIKKLIPAIEKMYKIALTPQMMTLYSSVLEMMLNKNDIVLEGEPWTSKSTTWFILGYVLNQPVYDFAFEDKTTKNDIKGSKNVRLFEKLKEDKLDYINWYINLLSKIEKLDNLKNQGIAIDKDYLKALKDFKNIPGWYDLSKETKKYIEDWFDNRDSTNFNQEYAVRLELNRFLMIEDSIVKATKNNDSKSIEVFNNWLNKKMSEVSSMIYEEESNIVKGLKLGAIVIQDEIDLPKSASIESQNSYLWNIEWRIQTWDGQYFLRHPDSRIIATRNGVSQIWRNELSIPLRDRLTPIQVEAPNEETFTEMINLGFKNLSNYETIVERVWGSLPYSHRVGKIVSKIMNLITRSKSYWKDWEPVYFWIRWVSKAIDYISNNLKFAKPENLTAELFDKLVNAGLEKFLLAGLKEKDKILAKAILSES